MMKIFSNVLTSGTSGAYGWSSALDMRHAKNGFLNVEYRITESATTFTTLVWSGCSTSNGIFTRSGSTIVSSVTSGCGVNGDGRGFVTISPDVFPFIKIGSYCIGGTPAMNVSLVVD